MAADAPPVWHAHRLAVIERNVKYFQWDVEHRPNETDRNETGLRSDRVLPNPLQSPVTYFQVCLIFPPT